MIIAALYWHGSKQLDEDSQNVTLTAAYSVDCADRHVRVTIHNGGTKVIQQLGFDLTGYQPNNSSAVARRYHNTERIIGVNQSWTHCWCVHMLDDVDPQ